MGLGERWLEAAYRGAPWLALLRPLAALYRLAITRRAAAYRDGRRPVWRAEVPVVVVGNITLGGTGKSPLVAWLGRYLSEQGWRPGIVSRGYGGKAAGYPLRVLDDTPVAQCGDEPRMLARQTGLPVVVDPDRPRGARMLCELGCDILISDDGLQHLALGRDIELVVVDGARGFGNGHCLPAGPLREPLTRLAQVDALLINGEPAFPRRREPGRFAWRRSAGAPWPMARPMEWRRRHLPGRCTRWPASAIRGASCHPRGPGSGGSGAPLRRPSPLQPRRSRVRRSSAGGDDRQGCREVSDLCGGQRLGAGGGGGARARLWRLAFPAHRGVAE